MLAVALNVVLTFWRGFRVSISEPEQILGKSGNKGLQIEVSGVLSFVNFEGSLETIAKSFQLDPAVQVKHE